MEAIVHPDGRLTWRGRPFRCVFGRGGVRIEKEEGDGATPAGLLPMRRVLYRADRVPPPRCALPIEPIAATDGWCDDPSHRDYNRPVHLAVSTRSMKNCGAGTRSMTSSRYWVGTTSRW